MSELWIKNRRESDLCSCEETYAVTNKAQKKNSEASMGFKHMTSTILVRILLYWLSYEASQEAGQVWVLFTPVIWREWCEVYNDHSDHMTELWLKNRSERDLCSCEVTYAVTNKAQKKFLILSISEIHVDTMCMMEMTWKDFRCFIRILCNYFILYTCVKVNCGIWLHQRNMHDPWQ